MNTLNRTRLAVAGTLMALATLAQAQYMWIDEKGLKQLSDRPPPPSVPLKNILKAPRGVPSAADIAADQPAPAAPASGQAKPAAQPQTLAERNADFRKRAKEKEEREQKDQAAEADKITKAQNCEGARSAKYSLETGRGITTYDKNGERSFMTDEQRAAEATRVNKALAGCS